jgi:hypothetical protein
MMSEAVVNNFKFEFFQIVSGPSGRLWCVLFMLVFFMRSYYTFSEASTTVGLKSSIHATSVNLHSTLDSVAHIHRNHFRRMTTQVF